MSSSSEQSIKIGDITVENYSEKSFAIFGDWKPYVEIIKALGGLENERLGGVSGIKRHGWIFGKKKKTEVEKALKEAHAHLQQGGSISVPSSNVSSSTLSSTLSSSLSTTSSSKHLEDRVQKLEKLVETLSSNYVAVSTELAAIRKTLFTSSELTKAKSSTKVEKSSNDAGDEDMMDEETEEAVQPMKSLIQRKRK